MVASETYSLKKVWVWQQLQLLDVGKMVVTDIERFKFDESLDSLKSVKIVMREEQVFDEGVG